MVEFVWVLGNGKMKVFKFLFVFDFVDVYVEIFECFDMLFVVCWVEFGCCYYGEQCWCCCFVQCIGICVLLCQVIYCGDEVFCLVECLVFVNVVVMIFVVEVFVLVGSR